jgi:hypothetical protein
LTTDHPSLADQLNGNGSSRNANRSRWLATTPFMRSSVSLFRAAGGIARRWRSASELWRWSWNRLSPCASSNFRHMLTFIHWFNYVVNSAWAFRTPSPGTHPEVPMSAFEVMRRATLGVFGAVAITCAGRKAHSRSAEFTLT